MFVFKIGKQITQSKVSLFLNEVWPFLREHTGLSLEATYLILPTYAEETKDLILYHIIKAYCMGKSDPDFHFGVSVVLEITVWRLLWQMHVRLKPWEKNAEFCGFCAKATAQFSKVSQKTVKEAE